MLPQGTIPRGEAFFDPVLHGKTGTARLAAVHRGARWCPSGCGGPSGSGPARPGCPTSPRSGRPPTVRMRVGPPVAPRARRTPVADTASLMAAIGDLLPAEARRTAPADPRGAGPDLPAASRGRRRAPAGAPTPRRGALGTCAGRGHGWPRRDPGGQRRVPPARPGQRHRGRRRAGLALDPGLLGRLAAGRPVALVSGTNGKTTTTRLLAVALGAGGRPVVTNDTGSNMPAGHVAALAAGAPGGPAVLEVDEGYLPGAARRGRPAGGGRSSTCRATSSTGPTRCACWPGGGAAALAAGAPTPRWWPTPTTRWWSGAPATAPGCAGWRPGWAGGRRRGLPGL